MSLEENKAIELRFTEEVVKNGNIAIIDELFATNFVDHSAIPGTASDREGMKQFFANTHSAFPDFHSTLEDMFAEGDKVVQRFTARGTHQGEFMGIAPTGKQVTITGINILRIEGGKIVEEWGEMNLLGALQELGAFPTPSQA